MAGTADPTDVWLLFEYSPSWSAKALEDSALSVDTRQWIDRATLQLQNKDLRVRTQLIRQPECDLKRTRLLIAYKEILVEFSGVTYDFLQTLDLMQVLNNPALGRRLEGTHYFVCTNGKRDVCCARFGRPIYTALREETLGDRGAGVWQINHVGGHRFAPNVLVLPQGVLYGRLTVESVPGFVQATQQGDLAFDFLRGRCKYSPEVQAAEAFSQTNRLELAEHVGDSDHATVEFVASNSADRSELCEPSSPRSISINVRRSATEIMAKASCEDDTQKPVRPYEQTDISVVDCQQT